MRYLTPVVGAFVALLVLAGVAFAADMIKEQGEDMDLASGISVVSDANAEGSAIRWDVNGNLARSAVSWDAATEEVVVRARGTQSGGSPALALRIKDGADPWQQVGSDVAVTTNTYQDYSFPFAAQPGASYEVAVKGKNIDTGRTTYVDHLRIPAVPTVSYMLLESDSASLSSAAPLNGSTQSGVAHIFTSPDTDVDLVRFYLDGTLNNTEANPPYEFNAPDSFDTASLSNGQHTIRAEVVKTDATVETTSATFTVDNAVAPPPDADGDGVPDSEDNCDGQPGPASNNGCPVSSLPSHRADSSADFADSVGVVGHIGFANTPYFQEFETRTKPALAELGVKHLRDHAEPHNLSVHDKFAELKQDLGINVIVHAHEDDFPISAAQINEMGDRSGGAIEAWEGLNEYNRTDKNNANPDWGQELETYQRQFYNTVQNSRYDLRVGCPSIQNPYPPISEIPRIEDPGCDWRLMHSYAGGGSNPDSDKLVQDDIPVANHVADDPQGLQPLVSSETGYTTDPGSWQEVDALTKAKYITRLPFVYFNRNIDRVYIYQLFDHRVDTTPQSAFGLLNNTWGETPAYRSLENTLDILQDPGPSFAAGSLDYEIEGASADVDTMLLQKRDGSFYIVMWQEVLSYDRVSDQQISHAAENVTVKFETAKDVAVFEPRTIASSGPADDAESHPDRQLSNVTQLTEPIGDEVKIIRVR